MMANFIEELFYGNIDPQARGYRKDHRAIKVLKNITDIEEMLTERLQGEDKDLFFEFCNGNAGRFHRWLPSWCKNDL